MLNFGYGIGIDFGITLFFAGIGIRDLKRPWNRSGMGIREISCGIGIKDSSSEHVPKIERPRNWNWNQGFWPAISGSVLESESELCGTPGKKDNNRAS